MASPSVRARAVRHSRLLLIAVASAVLAFGSVPQCAADPGAPSPQAAADLVRHALHDAFTTFSGDGKSHEQRRQLAVDLVSRYADLGRISAAILGPTWTTATDGQRSKFTALLVDYGLSVWARPMDGVADNEQQVHFERATPAGDDTVVHTFVGASGSEVPIDWTVAADPGGRLVIVDVTADNVSFIRTMRDDFGSYLHRHRGGLDGLMAGMQGKIDQNVASAN